MPATPGVYVTLKLSEEMYNWIQANGGNTKVIRAAVQHLIDMEDDK